jgi:hypothetical protein
MIIDFPMKKPPRRTALLIWLVFCWLVLAYPYGLLLFILTACGHWALQPVQQVGRREIKARASQVIR